MSDRPPARPPRRPTCHPVNSCEARRADVRGAAMSPRTEMRPHHATATHLARLAAQCVEPRRYDEAAAGRDERKRAASRAGGRGAGSAQARGIGHHELRESVSYRTTHPPWPRRSCPAAHAVAREWRPREGPRPQTGTRRRRRVDPNEGQARRRRVRRCACCGHRRRRRAFAGRPPRRHARAARTAERDRRHGLRKASPRARRHRSERVPEPALAGRHRRSRPPNPA